VAYAVAHGGSLPARPEMIKPVHVADLLSREGHPLAQQLYAARAVIKKQAATRNPQSVASARRALGVAAGAMIVVGTVVAGALGLNDSSSTPTAAGGEPVGAMPGHGSTGQPGLAPVQSNDEQSTATSSTDIAPQAPAVLEAPAADVPRQAPPRIGMPASKPPPKAAPAPAPPAQKAPLQPVTEPVGQTVGQVTGTLTEVVAPVTDTVDDTLTPALSLIGGLLGR
jgi:hypothetical protein